MKGEKDYRQWMPVKAGIHNEANRPENYKAGDIWVCSVGENVGYENDGKGRGFQRPVLIVSGINRYTCAIVPLSTTSKRTPYHYEFDGGTGKPSVALIRQVRVIDTSRLLRQIGKAREPDLKEVRERLRRVLGI